MGRNLLPFMTCLEMRNLLRSSDPLGKNLLLPSYFMEDFMEDLLLPCWEFLYETYWGRIFYFLIGICFDVLRFIREESSASFMGMMLDMPKLLRKSLLLPL